MFGEMLSLGRVKNAEKQQEYCQIIMRESDRLTHLINNVLDFSRIDAGKKHYSFQLGNLTEVVLSTVEAYAVDLRKQGFELEISTDEMPETWMDADAVSQALLNLLNNAAKYSRERKRITVRLWREGGQAHVEVADQGIGIASKDLPRIFDKFYRADDPQVRETRGTGLGLSLVKHAAEAHGGRVLVRSQKDEGSVFTLVLPLRAAPQEAKADA
jgi:signal transduction histidine kinase